MGLASCELRVAGYEFRVTSFYRTIVIGIVCFYELRVASFGLRVASFGLRVASFEFRV